MHLGDGHPLRRPVDLARRGVDDSPHGRGPTPRLEHVERPDDVGLHEFTGVQVAVGDRNHGAQMKDRVDALERIGDRLWVTEVAAKDLHPLEQLRREVLKPAVVVA